jgi:hypothetical protein
MNGGSAVRLTGLFVLGLSLFLFSACGYKNAPIPPQSVVPVEINDLRYTTDEKGVQLTWSYPVKTIQGAVLEDISAFELYWAEIPLDDYCRTCPVPFGEPIELAGGAPYDGKMRRKAVYESSLLRSGHKYFYKVRSRTSWWADSADSNIVTFVWFQPTAAPAGLTANPGDRRVELQWQPVTTFKDGSAVDMAMKYQVLRKVGGQDFKALGEPITATEHIDSDVQNGLKYFYAIQSMMVLQDELVSGGISEEMAATPIDLTPPAVPTGVTVVWTGVGMKIYWDKNDAADIGGYRVYRRAADSGSFAQVGQVAPEYALFTDASAEENVRYYYAVTAIDQATPPNESKKSKEATSRY